MINYKFIGWCTEDNHDKVWVCIQLAGDDWKGDYAVIWGRRGKKLQYKIHTNVHYWDMDKLADSKKAKGYDGVSKSKLAIIYPEFENDLEATAMWATLRV
mgnify:FL=1